MRRQVGRSNWATVVTVTPLTIRFAYEQTAVEPTGVSASLGVVVPGDRVAIGERGDGRIFVEYRMVVI